MKPLLRLLSLLLALSLLLGGLPAMAADTLPDEGSPTGYIVRLKDSAPSLRMLRSAPAEMEPIPYADGYYTAGSLEEIQGLIDAGLVEYVVPDAELELLDDPLTNDPGLAQQWYIDMLEAGDAWDGGMDGSGVTVAVIDSGIYGGHEDLGGMRLSLASRSFLGNQNDEGAVAHITDYTGHGTLVTGILAAEKDNGTGTAGLTDGVTILSLRCFSSTGTGVYHENSGKVSAVISAISYAIEQDVDVINMSFGGESRQTLLPMLEPLEKAAEQGILLVAAAGNGGEVGDGSAYYYPAAFDCVVGVGSVDVNGVKASRSQRNDSVWVTAPGVDIYGLGYTGVNSYRTDSGTSFAAPMVSAMAAMVKQADGEIDQEGFEKLLKMSAVDAGVTGYDTSYGWGIVNIGLLAEALTKNNSISYVLSGGRLEGTAGTDYINAYAVNRGASEATLPVPVWNGEGAYSFAGWYDNAALSGSPVTEVPQGTVGDVTYYAKWEQQEDVSLSGVTVRGIGAAAINKEELLEAKPETDTDGFTGFYKAALPKGTDLSGLVTGDILASRVNGAAVSVNAVPGSEGGLWALSFTANAVTVKYLLLVTESGNAAPAVADGQGVQNGSASPASYDGLTAAVPYSSPVSGWFTDEDALIYSVASSTGTGTAEIRNADGVVRLSYTPSAADAGKSVTLMVRANDGQFDSAGDVSVTVAVGEVPVSDSRLEPGQGSWDQYTGEDGGLSVTLKLFGNTLEWVKNGSATLTEGVDYTLSTEPAVVGGDRQLTFKKAYLNSLTAGASPIALRFGFSGGRSEAAKSVDWPLAVSNSAPVRYSVKFFSDGLVSTTFWNVLQGSAIGTLPTPAAKTGYTFGGWYTGQNGAGTKLTQSTIVNASLSPVANVISVYAKWTEDGGGGNGGDGGSGGGIVLPPAVVPVPVPEPEPVAWENPFGDVSTDSWFYESVEYVSGKGLFQGVTESDFGPEVKMSRAMLVTVLHRLAGKPAAAASSFSDVAPGAWYADAVVWASKSGIVTGMGDGFGPDADVTREQLIAMLYRYALQNGYVSEAAEPAPLGGFPDTGSISSWARDAMGWAVSSGVLNGKDGLLSPGGEATRAEVATMLARFAKLYLPEEAEES